mmetsp:Transcript_22428/g.44824  ORF Transcript_22428/g.44824 Transcript_22428/m.44824 type:complete len:619 (+) Transcript_22428:188-2044(+)
MDIDFDLDNLDDLENLEYDWDTPANNAIGPDDPQFRMGSLEDVFQDDSEQQSQQQQLQQQREQEQQPRQHRQSQQYQSQVTTESTSFIHQKSPQDHRGESLDAPGANGGSHNMNRHRSGSSSSYGAHHSNANGIDSNDSANAFQMRLDREREGRCADCGAQTHRVQYDDDGRSIKVPLTVPGEVHRGRCLFCHPLPSNSARSTPQEQSRKTFSNKRGHYHQKSQMGSNYDNLYPGEPVPSSHKRKESHLERHLGRSEKSRGHNREFGSSASVCTASSQQSCHSIYSHQSAPVWGNGQQHNQYGQIQQNQPQNAHGFAPDFVEQYQMPQNYQQSQYQQQQQQQQDDAGSVYSHSSHVSHQSYNSHQSYQSQQSYNQLSTPAPLVNISNDDNSVHSLNSVSPSPGNQYSNSNNLMSSMNSGIMGSNAYNDNNNSNLDRVLQQLQDDSLHFEIVIRHMLNFPSHPVVQEKGCAILWVQTYNSDVCLGLSTKGGVTTVLEAMRNHPVEARLIRASIEAVRNMCSVPMNRQFLLRAGGVPLVVESMTRHVEDADIQRSGCTALAAVAEGGMEFKIGVAECGGILAVMKAVESHPENDFVLRAAYQALRMLGYNPGARGGGSGG